ncbi:GNAT family N-acetyltransferase [Olivibacter ginsenosidimutans]|uniref:GNAT family N-acetyltransferase n=1 Tax=Olivibacter ginsenosidimutans TaxID=1176537 RepID=A0ABP9BDM2_9SPHI
MNINISDTKHIPQNQILELYKANRWSAAEKPDQLYQALLHSHTLISAWDGDQLLGLGNAISDGYLVVYYPHLLIHPTYQGQGIGQLIMKEMKARYKDFHMQMLTADGRAIEFYQKMGFTKAGDTQSMWIYAGNEH